MRRQAAGGVTRVDAGLLDVFHDAADVGVLAVADAVHVDFDRVRQIPVEQHRRIIRDLDRLAHVALEVGLLVHDFHRPAAQHIARAHHHRVTDRLGVLDRLGGAARGAVGRLQEFQLVQELLEALAVFGDIDRIRRGADDGHAILLEVARELQRRLPAVLYDHADGLFLVDDLQHVLQRQRLEVQPVAGVVVGGDGLGVAVDHDGLEPVLAQCERRMHAAVVEFDALPDAVRPAAQHDDLLAVGRLGLALFLVRGVHVRGVGREFRRAGIDPLVDRADSMGMARGADLTLRHVEEEREAPVREAHALQRPHPRGVDRPELRVVQFHLDVDDLLDLVEEPGVDLRQLVDLVEREPVLKGIAHVPDALRPGFAEFLLDGLAVGGLLVEAVDADLQPSKGLLERFLERAPDRHHLTD